MKVHITLVEKVRGDAAAREQALQQIVRVAGLTEVNLPRFQRHGILSGEMPDKKLADLRGLGIVESVTLDEKKSAIG